MRLLAFVGVCVLSLATVLSAQTTALVTRSLTLRLTAATLSQAVDVVAGQAGITVRFDTSVPVEQRTRPLSASPVSFVNAPLATVLEFLTAQSDLTFVVVEPTSVVIQAKAR